MKRLETRLMAAAIAVGLIAFLGCDAVKEDPDAAKNAAEEEVDDSDAEKPLDIDTSKEPKITAKCTNNAAASVVENGTRIQYFYV